MKITISDYRPEWAPNYVAEMALLAEALHDVEPSIEHVGSTSVPGLAAKPIIDIMIGLPDFSLADDLVPRIVGLGYEYISKYETTMPYRRYFIRRLGDAVTHHLHMVVQGGTFWQRHLAFRDFLRSTPEALAEYAELKRLLAEREWSDGNEYADAKTEFIRRVERLAGAHDGVVDERN